LIKYKKNFKENYADLADNISAFKICIKRSKQKESLSESDKVVLRGVKVLKIPSRTRLKIENQCFSS